MIKQTKYKDYFVDELGNVYSKKYNRFIKLKQMNGTWGYPNPENKPCIDHINTNKKDNRVQNLRWVTYRQNYFNPITYEKHIKINNSQEHKDKMKAIYNSQEYKNKLYIKILSNEINENTECYINIEMYGNFSCYQIKKRKTLPDFYKSEEYRKKMSLAKRKYNYQDYRELIENKGKKTWKQLSDLTKVPIKRLQIIAKVLNEQNE